VDSIRQVDVDLNYLLVLYSTVGLYRLVCLSVGENRTRPPKIKHELDGDTYGCQLENTIERSEIAPARIHVLGWVQWCHLANTIEQCVVSSDMRCRHHCNKLWQYCFRIFGHFFASRQHITEFWNFKLWMLFFRNSENCSYLLLEQGDSTVSDNKTIRLTFR